MTHSAKAAGNKIDVSNIGSELLKTVLECQQENTNLIFKINDILGDHEY